MSKLTDATKKKLVLVEVYMTYNNRISNIWCKPKEGERFRKDFEQKAREKGDFTIRENTDKAERITITIEGIVGNKETFKTGYVTGVTVTPGEHILEIQADNTRLHVEANALDKVAYLELLKEAVKNG